MFAALAAAVLGACVEPAADDSSDGAGPPAASTPCAPGQQVCAQSCTDTGTSAQHCGGCGVACAPGEVCQAGACMNVCGAGMGSCGGQCVSLSTNFNCGACGTACQAGQFCVGGACSTTCAGTLCQGAAGPECASLADDRNHCGSCNHACPAGELCVASQCVLDCGALTACERACVDVQSDAANCGGCGLACTGGKTCVQGACACPAGQMACGETCIDTAVDPMHCGGCGLSCGPQGLCEAGKCLGPDGCTDTPVAGLGLSAVDVYQSVQIPIMEGGSAIPTSMRNADVVVAREAVFRIHVTPEAQWMPREVSARIELTEVETPTTPDQTQVFFAALTPSGASSDDDPSSTFQIAVPAEAIGPGTRYAVTLVECGATAATPPAGAAPAAGATAARFPATGHQTLEARETGPLKVHIIPIGSPGPDVSEEALKPFKERLGAVYPTSEVIFTVGEPLQSGATSMCSALGSITSRRTADGAAPDVYYYGLTPGILGGQSGCSNATPTASGTKSSVGWAQGFNRDDGSEGAATMCHELGHAHGRLHAPCNVQDPDPGFPYPNAAIGVWAYDRRTDMFYEPSRKDMMSYCPEPRYDAWISDYTYQAILERMIAVNALAEEPSLTAARLVAVPWRLLVSDSAGVHWVPEPLLVSGTPEGTPVRAIVHGDDGPLQEIDVYQQPLEEGLGHAFMLTLPEPDPSWRAIEVPGLLALQPL